MAIIVTILVHPVYGTYIEGGPEIKVTVTGDNHVNPGDERFISIAIQNVGLLKNIFETNPVKYAIMYNASTLATNVKVELDGINGVEVNTPPQLVGSLPSGMPPVILTFKIKVDHDAQPGTYTLPVTVTYKKIRDVALLYQDGVLIETRYFYEDKTEKLAVPIVIGKSFKMNVTDVKTTNLFYGFKGDIEITVENTGTEVAKNTVLILSPPSGFSITSSEMKVPAGMQTAEISQMSFPGLPSIPATQPESFEQSSGLSMTDGAIYVGDFKPGDAVTVVYSVKVETDQIQTFPFSIKARYIGEDGKEKTSESVSFGVIPSEKPDIGIKKVESNVFSGSEGTVTVTIKNSGEMTFENAMANLEVSPPLSALVKKVYLGDLAPGEAKDAVFKIKASDDAWEQEYPGSISVKFHIDDTEIESDIKTIGIRVGPKLKFLVEGVNILEPGKEGTVKVQVTNAGAYTVKDATARVTVVDPFTSTDDSSYLGTLAPGETATAMFKLKVDADALPKTYALSLEVKYKDNQDEWVISDPIKMQIKVTEKQSSISLKTVGSGVAGLVVLGLILTAIRRRKR
jgi:hypothetical protein